MSADVGFGWPVRNMPSRFIARTSPRLEAGTLESSCAAIRLLRRGGLGCSSGTAGGDRSGGSDFRTTRAVKRLRRPELVDAAPLPPEAGCTEAAAGAAGRLWDPGRGEWVTAGGDTDAAPVGRGSGVWVGTRSGSRCAGSRSMQGVGAGVPSGARGVEALLISRGGISWAAAGLAPRSP